MFACWPVVTAYLMCVQDMKNVVSSLSLDDIENIATVNMAKTS